MNDHSGFYGLGIAPNILALLDKLGFKTPTPIQEQSIPQAIEGKDLIGVAQTGTGKTLAFGIPLLQGILKNKNARALVVLPTRELAAQVEEVMRKLATPLGVRTAVLIGGEAMGRQLRALSSRPQIILATPGRLIDHIQQKTVNLKDVSIVVLDEADRMLDMGFAPQLRQIFNVLPHERQTMLFSATMPEAIIGMARSYMKLPVRVEVARPGTAAKDVTQELFFVVQPEKPRLLEKILQEYRGSVIVFSRTKFSAKKIALYLRTAGNAAIEFHSNRSLNQRREALDGFKNGRYRVLVATDIAARGIDVSNIELVVNYDLPTVAEDYVHRIGRTGRAGGSGHAISFARPDQRGDVMAIERLTRSTLRVSALPTLPPLQASAYVTTNDPEQRRPYAPRGGNRFHSAPSRPGGHGAPAAPGAPRRFGSRPPYRGGGNNSGTNRPRFSR